MFNRHSILDLSIVLIIWSNGIPPKTITVNPFHFSIIFSIMHILSILCDIKEGLQMKKTFSFILALTVLMALVVGCISGEANYENGVHSEETGLDDKGWKSTITITVENGKIQEVNYDEVNEEGVSKTKDAEYGALMKEEAGITPREAFKELEEALKSSQDVDEVDVVSGATTSSEVFKSLVKDALEL